MGTLNIYHYFLYKTNYIYRAFLLFFLLAIAFLYFEENGKQAREKLCRFFRQSWKAGFLFYLAIILASTIFARKVETPYLNILGGFGFRNDLKWDFEICMNIIMFIPYTYLFLKAFKSKRAWKTALILSAATTAFIELSQLFFWLGECQVSDAVHNIIGGMIGCGIWYIMEKKAIIRMWKWIGKTIGQWMRNSNR